MKTTIETEKPEKDWARILALAGLALAFFIRLVFQHPVRLDVVFDLCMSSGIILLGMTCPSWHQQKFGCAWGLLLLHVLTVLAALLVYPDDRAALYLLSIAILVLVHCALLTSRFFHLVEDPQLMRSNMKGEHLAEFLARTAFISYYLGLLALYLGSWMAWEKSVYLQWVLAVLWTLLFLILFFRKGAATHLGEEECLLAPENDVETGFVDPMMERLYERFSKMMEEEKLFLSDDCSLENVARKLYTNKTYLSKMVNVCTGMNFSKLLNRYRVAYSQELYASDMRLKVNELSELSGFHNTVTYNMAFKFFQHMSPGDWCRKYREKQSLKKKNPLLSNPPEEELSQQSLSS